ncbi:MAG: CHAP domain-containing protein [Microbacteriaceae bacterium]
MSFVTRASVGAVAGVIDDGDEFAALLGARAAGTGSVAVPPPSRRAMREAERAEERRRGRRGRRVRASRPSRSGSAGGRASSEASGYPVSAAPRRRRHPLFALVTMAAVAGLFGCMGLPAYALSGDGVAESDVSTNASALEVSADATTITADRDEFDATSAGDLAKQRSNAIKDANWQAYQKSGAREAGDTYPWYSELSTGQGGGLSPLNYYYRECVDFVAWKLNEDVGSTEAPFAFDWSYLTPWGGNAYMWKYAWERHGWTVSSTPEVGSVAWFPGHVAYVAAVNDDGTVLLQEYNHNSDHLYGTRTVDASEVSAFLYAPPLPDD